MYDYPRLTVWHSNNTVIELCLWCMYYVFRYAWIEKKQKLLQQWDKKCLGEVWN